MKLRNAVLAVVGWYLLLPPYAANVYRCDTSAPLSRWFKLKLLDSKSACEDFRDEVLSALHDDQIDYIYKYKNSTCVASDDPRLKPN